MRREEIIEPLEMEDNVLLQSSIKVEEEELGDKKITTSESGREISALLKKSDGFSKNPEFENQYIKDLKMKLDEGITTPSMSQILVSGNRKKGSTTNIM